jgi:hypothetical protein
VKKGSFFLLSGVLAVAILVFAGCGGGGDETTSLTKSEFVKQANAICKEAEQERLDLFKQVAATVDPDGSKKERDKAIHDVIIVPYEGAAKEIESLGAPSGDEAKISALVEAMEASLRKVEKNPRLIANSTVQFAEANKLANDYGLTNCVL